MFTNLKKTWTLKASNPSFPPIPQTIRRLSMWLVSCQSSIGVDQHGHESWMETIRNHKDGISYQNVFTKCFSSKSFLLSEIKKIPGSRSVAVWWLIDSGNNGNSQNSILMIDKVLVIQKGVQRDHRCISPWRLDCSHFDEFCWKWMNLAIKLQPAAWILQMLMVQ